MVAVPAEHVTLTVDRESSFNVPHQLGCQKFRGNREPLALAPHVGTASLRLHNRLRLQEIERVLKRLGCTVGVKFRKAVHTRPDAGLIHGRQIVAFAYAYHAVSQGVDISRLEAAMLVFLGNLTPPFPGTGDDDSNFLLQVFGRDWLFAPIANFAVGKSGNDRMVRNHTEACWCAFERTQEVSLMSADRPAKTRPVYQETVILQPNRERGRLPRITRPPPPGGVPLGYLGIEHVVVGLYVSPATFASTRDEVFDHLLMFHRFCDFPVPAIRLIRKQLSMRYLLTCINDTNASSQTAS